MDDFTSSMNSTYDKDDSAHCSRVIIILSTSIIRLDLSILSQTELNPWAIRPLLSVLACDGHSPFKCLKIA